VKLEIRAAHLGDAEEICVIARRSITELCVADHDNDARVLDAWLGNKTITNVQSWISSNPSGVFVAVTDRVVCGVAVILPSGEVVLNYVSPDARFKGASKALMTRLEKRGGELGLDRITLVSTVTAHRFYRRLGYADFGEPVLFAGKPAFKMEKLLPAHRLFGVAE
jgi:GNAT superfamily N-acetyltransferase